MSTGSSAAAVLPQPMDYAEAAQVMRCSVRTVRRRVAAGKLTHIRDGAGRVLILPEFIAEYFAANTKPAQPAPRRPTRNPKYR